MQTSAMRQFPKAHPFSITSPLGDDVAFFTASNLSQQGISFYIGLAGLSVGIAVRNPRLAALSLIGWLTMLWMLLVDMGQCRAEPLRLFVLAHIGFGGATGLLIGLGLQRASSVVRARAAEYGRYGTAAALTAAIAFCAWMGWGNVQKLRTSGDYDIAASARRMAWIPPRERIPRTGIASSILQRSISKRFTCSPSSE